MTESIAVSSGKGGVGKTTIAVNVALTLAKNGNKTSNRTITISILAKINPGLEKLEFLKIVENKIYAELDLLN